MTKNFLNPVFNLNFSDLYKVEGLEKVNSYFCEFFQVRNYELYKNFSILKKDPKYFEKKESDLILIESAKILEDFLVFLFNIEKENNQLRECHKNLSKIPVVKKDFVQRVILKKYRTIPDDFNVDGFFILDDLKIEFGGGSSKEKISENFARSFFNEDEISEVEARLASEISKLIACKDLSKNEEEKYQKFINYAIWALYSKEGKKFHESGSLFKMPQKIDFDNLVRNDIDSDFKERNEFNLTDSGFNVNQALSEANYCIFCHKQSKDSCRKGLKETTRIDKSNILNVKKNPILTENIANISSGNVKISDSKNLLTKTGNSQVNFANDSKKQEFKTGFKKNPLNISLEGCPLDQKISEMNQLKSEFFSIGSIAIAMIDNPLLAGTGHRICNDCMKSCIFQKQDPVDIPQIESRALKDLLSLPFGFEIYSLLTRWNPLKFGEEMAKKPSNKKVLVAGLGPAGFTLSHYLLNQGHDVVAIDGLKIEPLNPEISGIDEKGNIAAFKPIKFVDEIYEGLQDRLIQGFGGVAEYGITSRWDKNFLTIIRLLLERRSNFRMFGGLRFGSSINDFQAFEEYQFDHIALCIGAGKPNIVDIKNNFAKGVRSSSDFLMALQLTGAFKKNLFTNLQIRQPIIVIGAGLTGVDTASEAQEYYILQIQRFFKRYTKLANKFGEEFVQNKFTIEESKIANEFLSHYQELTEIGKEKFLEKYHSKILYRKRIQDSPSYRLNHEELKKALTQKIEFVENQEPQEAVLDEFSHIKALKTKNGEFFDCKTLLIATGTVPNVSVKIEDHLNFELNGKYFKQIDENFNEIQPSFSPKSDKLSFFTRIDKSKKAISFFGDLHPNFEGNVVKAMASAKIGCKKIDKILMEIEVEQKDFSEKDQKNQQKESFFSKINQDFAVKIHRVEKVSKFLNEIEIKAPLLAKNSSVGQIFRLQNYHALAPRKNNQILAMEGVAVTATKVDRKTGVITGIILDYGGSTSFIKNFKVGENVIFMGPSGKPTEIKGGQTVLLIGGGRGNMPLTSIAEAFKQQGSKVIFVASYRKNEFVFRQSRMEKAADKMIYAIEEDPNLEFSEPQTKQFKGNATEVLKQYFAENKGEKIDRILTIGGDKMMAEIAKIRHENIIEEIADAPIAITSLNASMQCMMKGVCSQCLQKRQKDGGGFEYFYACANQDQNMDKLDFKHLSARCDQNSLQQKMTQMWITLTNDT